VRVSPLLWLLTNEADTRDETDGSAETKRSRGVDMRVTGTYIVECGYSVRIMNFSSYISVSCLQKYQTT
jgi:hypothetical protein